MANLASDRRPRCAEGKKKVLEAVAATQDATSQTKIRAALDRGDLEGAVQAVPWDELDRLESDLPPLLRDVLEAAGIAAESALPSGIMIGFDVTNPEAVRWIRDHSSELVREFVATSREAIRDLVRRAFEEGIDPRKLAQMIRGQIGLTDRLSQAVETYRQTLEVAGKTAEEIERRTGDYTFKLLRYRATVIARNETMIASNQGQRALWRQGVADGAINTAQYERQWIVTPDERLCPICRPLTKARAPLEGKYKDGSSGPPRHIQCRCAERLVRVAQGMSLVRAEA